MKESGTLVNLLLILAVGGIAFYLWRKNQMTLAAGVAVTKEVSASPAPQAPLPNSFSQAANAPLPTFSAVTPPPIEQGGYPGYVQLPNFLPKVSAISTPTGCTSCSSGLYRGKFYAL